MDISSNVARVTTWILTRPIVFLPWLRKPILYVLRVLKVIGRFLAIFIAVLAAIAGVVLAVVAVVGLAIQLASYLSPWTLKELVDLVAAIGFAGFLLTMLLLLFRQISIRTLPPAASTRQMVWALFENILYTVGLYALGAAIACQTSKHFGDTPNTVVVHTIFSWGHVLDNLFAWLGSGWNQPIGKTLEQYWSLTIVGPRPEHSGLICDPLFLGLSGLTVAFLFWLRHKCSIGVWRLELFLGLLGAAAGIVFFWDVKMTRPVQWLYVSLFGFLAGLLATRMVIWIAEGFTVGVGPKE